MVSEKTKIVLISGFLGSGKTTLLRRAVEYAGRETPVAVVQNEFGEFGAGSFELEDLSTKMHLTEINRGSIFCVCLYDKFRESISTIVKEHSSSLILIETTGLADPLSVGTLLANSDEFYLHRVVTVIDPLNYIKMRTLITSLDNQIRVADDIVINRTDNISKEELAKCREIAERVNPYATFFETVECKGYDLSLLTDTPYALNRIRNCMRLPSGELSKPIEGISSYVFRTTRKMSIEWLEGLKRNVPQGVLRMKGVVACEDGFSYVIQYANRDIFVKQYHRNCNTEIVTIGYGDISSFLS